MARNKLSPVSKQDFEPEQIDYTEQEFGPFLRAVRAAKKVSLRDFETMVNKTRAYLSDIELGNSNPPDKELLDTMIQQLQLDSYPRIVNKLYDLAAIGRKTVSSDIKDWLMEDDNRRELIRLCRDKEFGKEQIEKLIKYAEEL